MLIRNALLVVACTTFVAGSALAQQTPDKPAAQPKATKAAARDRVCREDAKKFCSDVRPGGGRVYQCLTSHNAELAPACRERLTAAKARYDEFANACKADAGKYCKGIPAGGGRILSCLKGRESDLTPDCKAQFNRAKSDTTVTQ
jgi:hypothetical protein